MTSARCSIGRDLEALGHDVVGDDARCVGLGERGLELAEVGGLQDPRLVARGRAGRPGPRPRCDRSCRGCGPRARRRCRDARAASARRSRRRCGPRAAQAVGLLGAPVVGRRRASGARRDRARAARRHRRAARRPDTSPSGPARRGNGRGRASSAARRAWSGALLPGVGAVPASTPRTRRRGAQAHAWKLRGAKNTRAARIAARKAEPGPGRPPLLQYDVSPRRKRPRSRVHDDFSQRCLHAVRVEGALRRRHHHVLAGPALRPDRPERRRQVDLHEAADRRAAAAEGHGRRARRSSASSGRTSSPSTRSASSTP